LRTEPKICPAKSHDLVGTEQNGLAIPDLSRNSSIQLGTEQNGRAILDLSRNSFILLFMPWLNPC